VNPTARAARSDALAARAARYVTLAALLAGALGSAACGGSKSASSTVTAPAATAVPVDATGSVATASEDVTFDVGGNVVPGTLVRPTTPGRHRAVVLMAGSGPTDRDWNSPLLPGTNGSAKLLAETLAKRGVIVLRFDKAGVGGNKTSLTGKTFDVYRDEGRAALALLRARADVAPDHLFVAGHSEGGMHAMRVALEERDHIAGLLLLSASGRSMQTLILAQVEPQLKAALPDRADAEMASLRAAFADFVAGKPVDPTRASQIPQLQMLVQSITNPATATLARSMFSFDPIPALAQIRVPIFIYNGRRDVQVDPDLDAQALAAANDRERTELHIASEADHVLKHETRSLAELRANMMIVQSQMNSETRTLDGPTVDSITTWLAAH
jgi:pimeloyl-ACP methyl ester carboxylesterase